jgi:hypothetical protein
MLAKAASPTTASGPLLGHGSAQTRPGRYRPAPAGQRFEASSGSSRAAASKGPASSPVRPPARAAPVSAPYSPPWPKPPIGQKKWPARAFMEARPGCARWKVGQSIFLRLQRTCAQRAHVTGGVGKGPQFDCDSLHVCPEICPLVAKQPPAGYPSAGELAKISQRAIVCRARRAPMISTPDQANPGTSCLQCETGS